MDQNRELMPERNALTLSFSDPTLETEFKSSYDKSVRKPLRFGIIISILSWYAAISLIYSIIPEKTDTLVPLTLIYIGSYFGFIVYATYSARFTGWYHLLGAISNAWAGLYTIYFCEQFPSGEHLVLPVLIFIIFFGSYMVRLRWMAGFLAALSYIILYQVYILTFADISSGQILLYSFVAWMVLIFAVLAGRVSEENNRLAFVQRKTIRAQSVIIEREKEVLLREVHHRVHNNLQIIVSLINLQKSKIEEADIVKHIAEMQRRILSMSLVHQRMNQTSNFIEIVLSDYAHELLGNIQQQFSEVDVTYTIEIPKDVVIDIETAIPLGLILNEMTSDFFQACLTERRVGNKCSLRIKETDDEHLCLCYKDNGPEFPAGMTLENADHLSLELIDALVGQLDGELVFKNENGRVYEIRFALPKT